MKRTLATEFEVLRLCHLLHRVIINCVSDGSAPRAVTASPSGAFLVSPLFPPAVTAGVAWTLVSTPTLLTGVVVDVAINADVEVADHGHVAVIEVDMVNV